MNLPTYLLGEYLQFDTQFEQIECHIYGQLSIPRNIHKQRVESNQGQGMPFLCRQLAITVLLSTELKICSWGLNCLSGFAI